jgi:hypothetical protein
MSLTRSSVTSVGSTTTLTQRLRLSATGRSRGSAPLVTAQRPSLRPQRYGPRYG